MTKTPPVRPDAPRCPAASACEDEPQDPIIALIEDTRRAGKAALAAREAYDRCGNSHYAPRLDALADIKEAEWNDLEERVIRTRPRTAAGCRAKADWMRAEMLPAAGEPEHMSYRAFKALCDDLESIPWEETS